MTLQELFEKYKIAEEDQEVVNTAIQAEKDRGISESKKKGKEILEKVTALNKLRDSIKNNLELDPDGDLDEQVKALKEKLEKASKNKDVDPSEIEERMRKETARQVKDLEVKWQKKVEDEQAKSAEKDAKIRTNKIASVLGSTFGDQIHLPKLVIESLIRDKRVDLKEDGETVVFLDGDEHIDLAKGFEEYKKKNPEAVRNNQIGGSGGGKDVKIEIGKTKKVTQEQFGSMSLPDQKAFYASGGKILEQ